MPVVPNPSVTDQIASLGQRLEAVEQRLAGLQSLTEEIRLLLGTSATPMPDGTMLVQTLHGVKLLIDPADRVTAPQLIVYRQWEAELSSFFRHVLTPASVVVDVGANLGYFTCLAGALIGAGGTGRVWAVEPNPAMVRLLRANLAINWSMAPVEVIEAAAGAEPGRGVLHVAPDRPANASLTASGDGQAVPVDITPLDRLLPDDCRADLLKIDVEGHEAAVLQGARGLIERSPGLLVAMEWSPEQMRSAGTSPDAMAALFEDLGLEPFALGPRPDFSDETRLTADGLSALAYANIVLRRRQS